MQNTPPKEKVVLMDDAAQKADILLQALKYIKKFEGKVIVIKYGGNAMENETLQASVLQDISMLIRLGLQIVVVHGGGLKIDQELAKQGIKKKTINGLRVTDDVTLKIVVETLRIINKECVDGLKQAGVRAQDYTAGMFLTKAQDVRLGHVGDITKVDSRKLLKAMAYGIVPVVSCYGQDKDGHLHNINADTAATKVAEVLKAEKLTILTNIDGVRDADGTRINHLSVADIPRYIENGVIHGGMIPKVWACADAVQHGVKKAHLLDGTVPRALLLEVFTDGGIGTEIVK
jgi:acetylglutamate kinase